MILCRNGTLVFQSPGLFLNSRFRQTLDIHNSKNTVIQDRTIYEDAHILHPLHAMGLMTHRDFENYSSLFRS